jgi:hypothetical protein
MKKILTILIALEIFTTIVSIGQDSRIKELEKRINQSELKMIEIVRLLGRTVVSTLIVQENILLIQDWILK